MRLALTLFLCLFGLSISGFTQPLFANAWITIPAGDFLMGSTPQEIEQAYQISRQGYGHDRVRQMGWFDIELKQHRVSLPAYRIQRTPVTQSEYAAFVQATHTHAPFVDKKTWASYGLVHPYARVRQYLWHDEHYPKGKAQHPVVLVSHDDAQAYAKWLSKKTGEHLRLPTEAEWEKAMRGTKANLYPWGNRYLADALNNADKGPFATVPVASFAQGKSPYGVMDGAGQVYEWTNQQRGDKYLVKGGSWDDHGGVCRPAARHFRPQKLKHIIIGFRLVDVNHD
jgi:formylglycine-generating enzyme required for sulfatase activity